MIKCWELLQNTPQSYPLKIFLDTCGDTQVLKSPHLDMDTGHFGSKSEGLRHCMMTIQKPHLKMDAGLFFGCKSKELHHTMHIHRLHLDIDQVISDTSQKKLRHFGSFWIKSKELCYLMIFVVPTWIWIQVIVDPSQKNYVII